MSRTPGDRDLKAPLEEPEEHHSEMQDESDPNSGTDWEEWAEREEAWRRAGGDEPGAPESPPTD